MTYRNGVYCCCRSSCWHFSGLYLQANTPRERPARRPVKNVPDVGPMAKTTQGIGASLRIWHRLSWAFQHVLLCRELNICLKIPLLLPSSRLADGKGCLGATQKIMSIDQVVIPRVKESLGQAVRQNQAWFISFRTQVHSTKSFHISCGIEPHRAPSVAEVLPTILMYCTIILAHIRAYSLKAVKWTLF